MPQGVLRARTAYFSRPVVALCLSIVVGGHAWAADPPRARHDPAQARAIELRVAPAAEPDAGLDLFQRVALFFEQIFNDRPANASLAAGPYEALAQAASVAELIFYSGPLEAGTVVINIDRLQVYRILGGGLAERYQETSEAAVFARVGLARQATLQRRNAQSTVPF